MAFDSRELLTVFYAFSNLDGLLFASRSLNLVNKVSKVFKWSGSDAESSIWSVHS